MFPIKKKWPILTGLVAAAIYGGNYYRISGLEHLRLEAVRSTGRPTTQIPAASSPPSTDVYGHSHASSSAGAAYGASRFDIRESAVPQPPGGWKLDRSERFNLFQRGPAEAPSQTLPVAKRTPSASPMETPSGFATPGSLASNGGMPSTDDSPQVLPLPGFQGDAPQSSAFQNDRAPSPSGAAGSLSAERIRIASFHVEALGAAKLNKPHVMELLVSIIKQHEVIALQGIRSSRDDILPMLTERVNQSGATYDYMIGPRVGRNGNHEQFAFLFDTSRIETDRYRLYTVDDPQDLMVYEPLVGWFRTTGISSSQAFTFSIVNMHLDASRADEERAILIDLIRAVEADGRQEDDWILLGDLAGGNQGLESLSSTGVRFAVRDIPTLVDGSAMRDTILFSPSATTEYTGRCGALDFLRKRNLSIAGAQELSNHLPVWAEFSVDEGGMPGRVAPGRVGAMPNSRGMVPIASPAPPGGAMADGLLPSRVPIGQVTPGQPAPLGLMPNAPPAGANPNTVF